MRHIESFWLEYPVPEQHRDRRRDAFTLSRADETGYFLRARCELCSVRRVYHPRDLVQLVGDVSLFDIQRSIRCEKCGRKDHMQVEFWYPTGQERVGLRIRRLVEIRTIRKVIWRDEDG